MLHFYTTIIKNWLQVWSASLNHNTMDFDSESESLSEYYQVPLPRFWIKKSQLKKIDFDSLNACHGTTLDPQTVKTFQKTRFPQFDAAEIILQHLKQETDFTFLSQKTGLSISMIKREIQCILAKRFYHLYQNAKYNNMIGTQALLFKRLMQKAAILIMRSYDIYSIKKKYSLLWHYILAKSGWMLYIIRNQIIKPYYNELMALLEFLKISSEIKKERIVINIEESINSQSKVVPNYSSPIHNQNIHDIKHIQIIDLQKDVQILQQPSQLDHPKPKVNRVSSIITSIRQRIPKRFASAVRVPLNKHRGNNFRGLSKNYFNRLIFRNIINKVLKDVSLKEGEQFHQSCLENNVDFESLKQKCQQILAKKSISTILLQQFFDSLSILQKKVLFEQLIVKAAKDYPQYVERRGKMEAHMKQSHIQMAQRFARVLAQYYKAEISSQLSQRIAQLQILQSQLVEPILSARPPIEMSQNQFLQANNAELKEAENLT